MWEERISSQSGIVLFGNGVEFSLEMALSLNPQGFTQSYIRERRLPLMPYKPLA